jgi:hypothetical protein
LLTVKTAGFVEVHWTALFVAFGGKIVAMRDAVAPILSDSMDVFNTMDDTDTNDVVTVTLQVAV